METIERPEVYEELAKLLGMDPDARVIDIANEALEYIRATENWDELGEFVIDFIESEDFGAPNTNVSLRNISPVHEGEARRLAAAQARLTVFSWDEEE